jgi:hypothetical protein
MATRKRSPQATAAQIVEKEMPGFRVVAKKAGADVARRAPADATSPQLEVLQSKYLPTTSKLRADRGTADSQRPGEPHNDTELVVVQPPGGEDRRGPAAKTLLVSKKRGKVIGAQG